MTLASMLHLDRLTLRNFRCFKACEIELHGRLTVLIAENGSGKTAILDAIGIALEPFVETVSGIPQFHGFERTDVRRAPAADGTMTPELPMEIVAAGSVDGARIQWTRARKRYESRARTTTKETAALHNAAEGLRARIEGHAAGERAARPLLPIVAFYGTGRLWSEHRLTQGKRTPEPSTMGRLSGYIDCLSSSSSFKSFLAWYEAMSNAARSPASSAYGPSERPEKLLAAVRKATQTVLEPRGLRCTGSIAAPFPFPRPWSILLRIFVMTTCRHPRRRRFDPLSYKFRGSDVLTVSGARGTARTTDISSIFAVKRRTEIATSIGATCSGRAMTRRPAESTRTSATGARGRRRSSTQTISSMRAWTTQRGSFCS